MSWLLVAALAVYVTGWFYTLSAVHVALACTFLVVIATPDWRGRLLRGLVTGVVLCSLVLLHPTFAPMLRLAGQGGGTTVDGPPLLVCSILLAFGLGATILLRPQLRAPHIDAIAALAFGGLATLGAQAAVFFLFGQGSPYLLKKHAFLIGTAAVMVFAVLGSELCLRVVRPERVRKMRGLMRPALLVPVTAVLFFVAVFGWRDRHPLPPLFAYDDALRSLVAGDARLTGVTLSLNAAFPAHQNFTVALARLRPGWDVGFEQLQRIGFWAGDPIRAARYRVVNAAEAAGYLPECQIARDGDVSVVAENCRR
jgi:hypothetical protein